MNTMFNYLNSIVNSSSIIKLKNVLFFEQCFIYVLIDKRKPTIGVGCLEVVMWTKQELIDIKERAELEASIQGNNEKWRHACLGLATAADRLESITNRIELGLEVATLQPPIED